MMLTSPSGPAEHSHRPALVRPDRQHHRLPGARPSPGSRGSRSSTAAPVPRQRPGGGMTPDPSSPSGCSPRWRAPLTTGCGRGFQAFLEDDALGLWSASWSKVDTGEVSPPTLPSEFRAISNTARPSTPWARDPRGTGTSSATPGARTAARSRRHRSVTQREPSPSW